MPACLFESEFRSKIVRAFFQICGGVNAAAGSVNPRDIVASHGYATFGCAVQHRFL
jgi:hypothetical protein